MSVGDHLTAVDVVAVDMDVGLLALPTPSHLLQHADVTDAAPPGERPRHHTVVPRRNPPLLVFDLVARPAVGVGRVQERHGLDVAIAGESRAVCVQSTVPAGIRGGPATGTGIWVESVGPAY